MISRSWGHPRGRRLNLKEGLGRLLFHSGLAVLEGQCHQHLKIEALKVMARRRGQCGADGGLISPPHHPPLRLRPPHQQRAKPARWRGKAGVAGDGHQDGDQLFCGVGHGGAVGCSIGFPGAVTTSQSPPTLQAPVASHAAALNSST